MQFAGGAVVGGDRHTESPIGGNRELRDDSHLDGDGVTGIGKVEGAAFTLRKW